MQAYERHPADIVKSVQQRWLLVHWRRLRNGRPLPLSANFGRDQFDPCFDDLTILDVLPHNGSHRFRIFDHGKNVGAMYAGQCAGKFLDEVLPQAARASTLETYDYVVQTGIPVYTVSSLADAAGRPILYERLLLPFGDTGGRVVRIFALLETISTEGMIERKSLLSDPRPVREYLVKAELRLA